MDDHPIMLSGLLENVSWVLPDAVIVAFKNAKDALCYNNGNGCDVLISEIELCGTDGLMLAKKIKLDPAVMASPFITTIVDTVTLVIYFSIASKVLGL